MTTPPPPQPPDFGASPPPPGRAQRLVARSGFVVYEGGRTVFDEAVLVYAGRPRQWPDFDVQDHVGRALGSVRLKTPRHLHLMRGPTGLFDPGGAELLHIQPENKLFSFQFRVSGVANAVFTMPTIGSQEIGIGANNERYGSVSGRGLRGLSGPDLTLFDHDHREVGAIKQLNEGGLFSSIENFVVSLDPSLRGELRRLILAAPVVIAFIRRAQKSST